ncbi:hypothetical protein ACWA06_18530 [Serratia rhizosphaerae]|uniref:hypothetical protein n=1 Tax=unclassified Serratia (in: enterobacteria) TaxID=2647522 RepID=UPI000CF6291F|nr:MULTISPECIES: hypothetical protein [unclassified Serratia (in: enterobacteria)]MBU3894762.1 hypothetical protein [Serratia rubidaea]AVJ18017.1 hypothetical protein CLM71_13185 [Serratia sp. MYb239]MCA4822537.1 hypothetical protein [Serratia rubidaea]QNK34447.1 hypothetical protein HF675_10625 [Serratia sp. JUb9]QPT11651.1 hypothetical protein I6G37_14050 [Serratia rubidaea]
MSEENNHLPQLLEHMVLNLRMIYARSTLMEKALARILADDNALKSDVIEQLQQVNAATERDKVDLEQARQHLIDVFNSIPAKE